MSLNLNTLEKRLRSSETIMLSNYQWANQNDPDSFRAAWLSYGDGWGIKDEFQIEFDGTLYFSNASYPIFEQELLKLIKKWNLKDEGNID